MADGREDRHSCRSAGGDAAVSDVARHHDITPSQLFGWIRRFREDIPSQSSSTEPPRFVPAVIDTTVTSPASSQPAAATPAAIEIVIGTAMVRIGSGVDPWALGIVLKTQRTLT